MQLTNIRNFLNRLHEDEQGDIPVGPLLIIGLIAALITAISIIVVGFV